MRHRQHIRLVIAAALVASACSTVVDNGEAGFQEEIDFALENRSADTIFIQEGIFPTPSWLRLTKDGEIIRIKWDCSTPCPCDPNEPCMVCEPLPPSVREVAPGSEVVESWRGVIYEFLEQDGRLCHELVQLEAEELEAQICYGLAFTQDTDGTESFVDDVQCQSFAFEYGVDEEVRLIVE